MVFLMWDIILLYQSSFFLACRTEGEVVKFLLDDLVGTVCFKTLNERHSCHSLVVPHQIKYYAISFLKSLTSKQGIMNFFLGRCTGWM